MNKMTRSLLYPLVMVSLIPGLAPAQTWEDITANVGATLTAQPRGLLSDGARLYVLGGTQGQGVLVSSDGGASFSAINAVAGAGYTLTEAQLLSLREANGQVWVSGSSGNSSINYLHRLGPGGTTWERAAVSGFPAPAQIASFGVITDLVWEPVSSQYFAIAEIGGVWASSDALNWSPRTEGFGGIGAPASLATVDGKVFAMRPLSGGPQVTTDGGLTWAPTSPYTDGEGGFLTRSGEAITFNVSGFSGTSTTYMTPDGGETWKTITGLPLGMQTRLSGDGELLFSATQNNIGIAGSTAQLLFSATAGLTWQDLPTGGLQLNSPIWPDTNYVGVQTAVRLERHGNQLFLLATEIIDASFSTVSKLFRLDLTGVDLRPETAIVDQPVNRGAYTGEAVTLEVFAVGQDLTYQWMKGGQAVPGANAPTLTLTGLTAAQAGEYTVVVTGARGQVTSDPATVEVRAARLDGQLDITYDPEVTDGGHMTLLSDGSILRVRNSVPSWIARMDQDGQELGKRNLSAFLPTETQFVPQYHLVDEEGRLIVAGYSSGSNTASNQRVRRFDPMTLEDDPSFPILSGFNGQINGLAELPGRGYLLSGAFESIAGVPVKRVVLIRYDGSLDPDYAAGMPLLVQGILAGADGTAYVRGDFGGTPYIRFTRLDQRGQVVGNFPAFTDSVEFMHRLNDGRLLLVTTWNGNRTINILQPDGTPDPAYTAGGTFNNRIHAIAEQPDGKLIVTGEFTAFAGQPVAGHVRLLPSGSVDGSYDASASFTGNIFFSLRISSALYTPGRVFLSNAGDALAFQGYPNLGAGPVPVFAQNPDLAILRQSLSRQAVPGSSVTLRVQAHGSTPVGYQWQRDGVNLPGATGATLTLNGLDASQAGIYRVVLSNASGSLVSQPIVLSLVGSPEILVQPEAVDLLTGATHTLTVEADGASPLSYQWRRNGVDLPGATSASLTLSNVQPAEAGSYSVVVSNPFGSLTSEVVAVTVNTVTGQRITTFLANANNAVTQIVQRPDGVLAVRGTFTTIGGGNASRFAFLDPQTGSLVPDINRGGFSQNVNGLAVQPDGKVIVAGQFTNALGSGRDRLVRLNLDGSIDETFNPGGSGPSAVPGGIWALADGRILVFSSSAGTYNGVPVSTFYRLLADGTVDPTWAVGNPPTGVYAVAESDDGSLYVGGAFGHFNNVPNTSYLVRLFPDGTLDTAFNEIRPTFDYDVNALTLLPDGKLLVGGRFNSVGAPAQIYRKIARLNADGSLDTTFFAHSTVSSSQSVVSLSRLPGGKILLGGTFQSWPGVGSNASGQYLLMLRPDGTIDTFFRPGSTNNVVNTVLALPDGRAYVGGSFSTLAGGSGPSAARIGVITVDATDLAITRQPASVVADLGGEAVFSVGIFADGAVAYQWFKDDAVLVGETGPELVLAGLTQADAGLYRVRVSHLGTGSVEDSQSARLTVLAEPVIISAPESLTATPGGSASFTVEAIGRSPLGYQWRRNGTPLAGATEPSLALTGLTEAEAGLYDVILTNPLGSVTSAPVALSLATPVGTADPSFDTGDGPNNSIFVIKVLSSGRIAVGGAFTAFAGQQRFRFALLEADGTLVSLSANPTLTGGGTAIIEQADGKLLVGHGFGYLRLNPDGSPDAGFNTVSMQVGALATDDTYLYVGGYTNASTSSLRRFSLVDGAEDTTFRTNTAAAGFSGVRTQAFHLRADGSMLAVNQNGLMRKLNPDGTADPSFSSPTVTGTQAIYEMTDGKIWLAGSFSTVGGQPRRVVVRLLPDGSLDNAVGDAGISAGGTGRQWLADGDHLFLAGDFSYSAGGKTWNSLLRLSMADGSVDETFLPVFSGNAAFALARDGQDRLLVGGSFSEPGNRLVRLNTRYEGSFSIVGQPVSQSVEFGSRASLSVAWVGGGTAQYQWSRNGIELPGATSQELVIPAVSRSDEGAYTVTVTVGEDSLTSAAATLTVTGGPAEPTGFFAWPALAGLPEDQRDPLATPAGDGISNLLKYALGIEPMADASDHLPQVHSFIDLNGQLYLALEYVRPFGREGIQMAVKAASDPGFASQIETVMVGAEDLGDGWERVTVRPTVPFTPSSPQYMRLEVTTVP